MKQFTLTLTAADSVSDNDINKVLSQLSNTFPGYLKMSPTYFALIREWAKEKGILDHGNVLTQYAKLNEEAGELARAILLDDKAEIKDAIGDCIVVLTSLSYLTGLSIEECIASAYDVISKRKGQMKNGNFIKES